MKKTFTLFSKIAFLAFALTAMGSFAQAQEQIRLKIKDTGDVAERSAHIWVKYEGKVEMIGAAGELKNNAWGDYPLTGTDREVILKGKIKILFAGNKLDELDVTKATSLDSLEFTKTSLTSLDLSGCANLKKLACPDNDLEEINLSGCPNLKVLDVYKNKLKELDASACTELVDLTASYNQIEKVKLNSQKLRKVSMHGNKLVGWEMSKFIKSLPEVPVSEGAGSLSIRSDYGGVMDQNKILVDQVSWAKEKNWRVFKYENNAWANYDGEQGTATQVIENKEIKVLNAVSFNHISIEGANKGDVIRLVSLTGKTVLKVVATSNDVIVLSKDGLKKGIYVLVVGKKAVKVIL